MQFSQFYKYSESVDLLRKSLLPHIWRVSNVYVFSCKHERHIRFKPLYLCIILHSYTLIKSKNKKIRTPHMQSPHE